jgi:hypothetical protein
MTGAGILVCALGAFSLAYIVADRRRLRAQTRRVRTLPALGELPLGLYVGVQALGCVLCLGLGIWMIVAG